MARTQFESYIKFFEEPQTHRQVRQKSNGQNVEVICLPMNVRQSEVWIVIGGHEFGYEGFVEGHHI